VHLTSAFNLQIVVKGAGRHFCAGIDVNDISRLMVANKDLGKGREQEKLRRDIKKMQVSLHRTASGTALQTACLGD
jgi:enoyl-CoA hydratase/carnithine racemase